MLDLFNERVQVAQIDDTFLAHFVCRDDEPPKSTAPNLPTVLLDG
jgi:hypothetical protein